MESIRDLLWAKYPLFMDIIRSNKQEYIIIYFNHYADMLIQFQADVMMLIGPSYKVEIIEDHGRPRVKIYKK